MDDYIEISFTISPEIRKISFHNPESLSIEDYFYKYIYSRGARFPGGIKCKDAVSQSVKILSYLMPKEKKSFEIEVSLGILAGVDLLNQTNFVFKRRA